MPDNLHIPYKFREANDERVVREVVRQAVTRHPDDFEGSIIDVFDRLRKDDREKQRQSWLEIERWAVRALNAIGPASLYDAIIDPALSRSQPNNHLYKNFSDLALTEPIGSVNSGPPVGNLNHKAFCIGVVARNTFEITETGNINITESVVIEALGWGQQGGVAWGTSTRPTWNFAGFTFNQSAGDTNPWPIVIRGLEIKNGGSAVTTIFTGNPPMLAEDCRVDGTNGLNPATQKITNLTDGILLARDCFFENTRFSTTAYLFDCGYGWSMNASFTLTSSDLYWNGGGIDVINSGVAGTTMTIGGSSKQIYVTNLEWNVGWAVSTAGITSTISITNTGTTYFDLRNTNTNLSISVATGAGHTTVLGDYNVVTFNAASTIGRARIFRGQVFAASSFTGPGEYDILARQGAVITFAGSGVLCHLQAHSSASPIMNLTGCDDSLFIATVKPNSGGKPYAIDAASDRSILIVAGANQAGWGSTPTNASTSTVVLTEGGGSSFYTVAEARKDILLNELTDQYGVAGVSVYPPVTGSAPTGAAGGSLASTYPNPTFAGRDASVDEITKDIVMAVLFAGGGITTIG